VALLLSPAIGAVLCRVRARKIAEPDRFRWWIVARRRGRVLLFFLIALWRSLLSVQSWVHQASSQPPTWALAIVLPSIAVLVYQFIGYSGDAEFLRRRWTAVGMLRLAAWRSFSLYIPLLLLSFGAEDIQNRLAGIVWMLIGGLTAFVGSLRLRSAEGLKLRPVKSGELYKRALILSRKAEVPLRHVCVVPPGKGRLTNAYGGGRRIAVTEDYGHWLHGPQLDFVIGHESHVKDQHGLKKLAAIFGIFGATGLVVLWRPRVGFVATLLVSVGLVVIPLVCVYFVSRRFEYDADLGALNLTGSAEAGIRSLTDLYTRTGIHETCTWIEEVFSTHPSLSHRVSAIRLAASRE